MRQNPGTRKSHGEKVVKDIRRATRKQYSAEEKIRIVLDGLKGEDSIAELCLSGIGCYRLSRSLRCGTHRCGIAASSALRPLWSSFRNPSDDTAPQKNAI